MYIHMYMSQQSLISVTNHELSVAHFLSQEHGTRKSNVEVNVLPNTHSHAICPQSRTKNVSLEPMLEVFFAWV